ncbi:MAG TPA: Mov34/MPN/PAD-1 family protein [Phycisphaerae bacterium]|nr:Mov34/MPN/PAD-1 family protein [Phycisphaerae bacterium]HRW52485.1 Mov34/MPN/PAD-1 family protein [Phycisphaerae bacterium]
MAPRPSEIASSIPSDDPPANTPSNPRIPADWRRELAAHAAEAAPAECCGLILRDAVRRCRNALPSDRSGGAYELAPADAIYVAEHASDGRILAIYHSHPEGPANWSADDERAAWFAGAPLYPQIDRWIIGRGTGASLEVACYQFQGRRWRRAWRAAIQAG